MSLNNKKLFAARIFGLIVLVGLAVWHALQGTTLLHVVLAISASATGFKLAWPHWRYSAALNFIGMFMTVMYGMASISYIGLTSLMSLLYATAIAVYVVLNLWQIKPMQTYVDSDHIPPKDAKSEGGFFICVIAVFMMWLLYN